MGCPSEVTIGDNLTFSITTHDPDTGVLTDADSAPSYRVYEDETGAAILTGSMAKLDDSNTTGFYTEQLACTSGNGFESGKTYTIYIEATVDSDQGGISFGFRALEQDADSVKAAVDALNDPTAASVADAVLDELLSGHTTPGSVGVALTNAGPGTGNITHTITVNDGDGNPISGVEILVSTDAAKASIIRSENTDDNGQAVFYLDAGTYYTWKTRAGYNFTNPETITVA